VMLVVTVVLVTTVAVTVITTATALRVTSTAVGTQRTCLRASSHDRAFSGAIWITTGCVCAASTVGSHEGVIQRWDIASPARSRELRFGSLDFDRVSNDLSEAMCRYAAIYGL